ncbi:MAG: hypothetical protein K6A90_05650 [Lachnospiraceae bacterium]|nr:hypothetical protein [Lachnospiraceae bacterium]
MSDSTLFRQKSIDKISSPEELNDYIKVSNPGMWMLLIAVILVLLGMVTWGTFGRLETRISVPAKVDENKVVLYVEADDLLKVKAGQPVYIASFKGEVTELSGNGNKAGEVLGDISLQEAGFDKEDIVYEIDGEIDCPNGIYLGEIVIDQVSPMSFLTGDAK